MGGDRRGGGGEGRSRGAEERRRGAALKAVDSPGALTFSKLMLRQGDSGTQFNQPLLQAFSLWMFSNRTSVRAVGGRKGWVRGRDGQEERDANNISSHATTITPPILPPPPILPLMCGVISTSTG
jgi:hypothetical protein